MENKILNTVKWFILFAVLVYTAGSTIELVRLTTDMTGISLVVRQVVAVLLTDGGVILWHALSNRYKAEGQRNIATFMQWACFGVLGVFFVASTALALVDASLPLEIATGWTMPLSEAVGYAVLVAMAGILFGTPAAFFFIEWQSPEHRMSIESTKARQILNDRLVLDFKTGQAAVMDVLSSNGAVERLKAEMQAAGYTEAEAAILAEVARAGIARSKPGINVGAGAGAEVTPAANFFERKATAAEVPVLKPTRRKSA